MDAITEEQIGVQSHLVMQIRMIILKSTITKQQEILNGRLTYMLHHLVIMYTSYNLIIVINIANGTFKRHIMMVAI